MQLVDAFGVCYNRVSILFIPYCLAWEAWNAWLPAQLRQGISGQVEINSNLSLCASVGCLIGSLISDKWIPSKKGQANYIFISDKVAYKSIYHNHIHCIKIHHPKMHL